MEEKTQNLVIFGAVAVGAFLLWRNRSNAGALGDPPGSGGIPSGAFGLAADAERNRANLEMAKLEAETARYGADARLRSEEIRASGELSGLDILTSSLTTRTWITGAFGLANTLVPYIFGAGERPAAASTYGVGGTYQPQVSGVGGQSLLQLGGFSSEPAW